MWMISLLDVTLSKTQPTYIMSVTRLRVKQDFQSGQVVIVLSEKKEDKNP